MASKKKVEDGGLSFDADLDFDLEDLGGLDPASQKKRSPIMEIASSAGENVKSKLKSGSFWSSIARKALPKYYETVEDGAKQTAATLSSIYYEGSKSLKPELSRIGRSIDAMVPAESKRLKAITRRLGLDDEGSSYSAPSKEEMANQAIAQSQAEIFEKQLVSDNAREARASIEQRIRDKTDSKRFAASINVLAGMREDISRMAAYTTTVDSAWKKKSLELQYRSYFVQAEMLKSMEKYGQNTEKVLEAIRHNTGLPDYAKLHTSERFKELTRSKIGDTVLSGLGAGLGRMKDMAIRHIGQARDALSQASMMGDGLASAIKMSQEMGGGGALSMGSNIAMDALINHLVNKHAPKLKKFVPEGGKVSQGLAMGASLLTNPDQLVKMIRDKQWWKDATDYGNDGLGGKGARLLDMYLGALKAPGMEKGISKGHVLGEHEDAFFDRRVYKSITEIIPGYLARMLQYQELTFNLTRFPGVSEPDKKKMVNADNRKTYDWKREVFSTEGNVRQTFMYDLKNNAATRSLNYQLDYTNRNLLDQELSGDQNKRIKQFFSRLGRMRDIDPTTDAVDAVILADRNLKDEDKNLLLQNMQRLRGKGNEGKFEITKEMVKIRILQEQERNEARKIHERIERSGQKSLTIRSGTSKLDYASGDLSLSEEATDAYLTEEGITDRGESDVDKASDADLIMGRTERTSPATGVKQKLNRQTGRWEDVTTSDRNVKRNVKTRKPRTTLDRLKRLGTYTYEYAKGKANVPRQLRGAKRGGYMAQEVKKQMGETAAPGGVVIDQGYMNSANTEAIKELSDKVDSHLGDPTAVGLLSSIDRRLAHMNSMNRFALGIALDPEEFKRTFGKHAKAMRERAVSARDLLKEKTGKARDRAKQIYDENKAPTIRGSLYNLLNLGLHQGVGAVNKLSTALFGDPRAKKILDQAKRARAQTSEKARVLGKKALDKATVAYHMSLMKAENVLNKARTDSEKIKEQIHKAKVDLEEKLKKAKDKSPEVIAKLKQEGEKRIQGLLAKYDQSQIKVEQLTSRVKKISRDGVKRAKEGFSSLQDGYDDALEKARQHLEGKGVSLGSGRGLFGDVAAVAKWGYGAAKETIGAVVPGIYSGAKSLLGMGKGWLDGTKDRVSEWLGKPKDLYAPGIKDPVITADLMSRGFYLDSEKRPITNLEQLKKLKGALYKQDGSVAVTEQQMQDGLYDVHQNKLKFMVSSVRDIVLGGAGYVAGKAFGALKDVKNWIFRKAGPTDPNQPGFIGRLLNSLSGVTEGVAGGAKKVLGMFGLGGGKSDDTLQQILKIMKRWDSKWTGTDHGPDPTASSGTVVQDPNAAAVPSQASADPSQQGSQTAPTGTLTSGNGGMNLIAQGIDAAKRKGSMLGSRRNRARMRLAAMKLRRTGAGRVGARLGAGIGARVGGLFGGRVGRMGGALRGAVGKGLNRLKQGADSNNPNATPDPNDPNQPAPATPTTGLTGPAVPRHSFFQNTVGAVKRLAGRIAWNDTDGSGRRDGDFRDRLDAQRQEDEKKRAESGKLPQMDAAKYQGEGFLGKIFGFITGGLGKLFGMAGGLLGNLTKGALGIMGKGALGLLKLPFKALGGAMRGGGMLARGIGALARPLGGRMAASGIARFAATWALRGAVISGAVGLASGGTLGAIGAAAGLGLTALAGVLSSPVLLGATAIGLAGYGAYKAYKYFTRDKVDEFQKLRYLQYGFADEGFNHKLSELEAYLLDNRVGYQGSKEGGKQAYLIEQKIDPAELVKIFDIEPENEEQVNSFTEWFQKRFKPFFLTAVSATYKANPKIKMMDLDDATATEKLEYYKGAAFEGGPYDANFEVGPEKYQTENTREECGYMYSHAIDFLKSSSSAEKEKKNEGFLKKMFKWTPIGIGATVTSKAYDKLSSLFTSKSEKEQEKKEAVDKREAAVAEQKTQANKGGVLARAWKGSMYGMGAAAGQKALNSVFGSPSPDEESSDMGKGSGGIPVDPSANKSTQAAASQTPPSSGGAISEGSDGMKFIKLAKRSVNLSGLNPSVLKNFLGMVQEYGETTGKSVQVNDAYRSRAEQERLHRQNPAKAARPGKSLHEFGLALDIQSSDANAMEKLGLMRKYGFTRPVGQEAWHIEPAGIQGNLDAARKDPHLASQMVDAGLRKGGGGYALVGSARKYGRDQQLQLSLLNAPSDTRTVQQKIDDQLAFKPTVASSESALTDASRKLPPSQWAQAAGNDVSVKSMIPEFSNKDYNATQKPQYQLALGDQEVPPTGQDASSASYKESSNTQQGVLDAIAEHSKKTGIAANNLQVIAAVESSLNPSPKNDGSKGTSAKGLFQFTDGTWREYMQRYKSKYGLTGNETPQNIRASTVLAGEYIKANFRSMKSVRQNPTLVDAYLAHFLGAHGAKTFLSADPNAIAAQVLPSAAKNNPSIFYDGSRPRTIKEVYTFIAKKLEKAAKDFGITGVSTSGALPQAKPQSASANASARPAAAGSVGANATAATESYTGTGAQAAPMPKEPIAAAPMMPTANRITDRPRDSGESVMGQMSEIASKSLDIQKKSLDTVIEIRDLIKEFVKNRPAATAPAAPAPSRPPARVEPMEPVVNINRRRSF